MYIRGAVSLHTGLVKMHIPLAEWYGGGTGTDGGDGGDGSEAAALPLDTDDAKS